MQKSLSDTIGAVDIMEKDLQQLDRKQRMENWILKASDNWLAPVFEVMHAELLKHYILHTDETTLQVLHEPGKSVQSKSYMWLYRTGCRSPDCAV